MIVDMARAYSPLRPATWCDSSIGIAPSRWPDTPRGRSRATRSSCAGLTTLLVNVDDERLGARVDELADLQAHVVLVERQEHVAEVVDALAHLADHRDRHDRLGPLRVGDVHLLDLGQALAVAARARQRNRDS